MAKNIIDVSSHNGAIDWTKVKGNTDGAIIRLGYRGYSSKGTLKTDVNFVANIKGAINQGIPVGVYWFTTAISKAEAIAEADYVAEALKGYKLSFPVYLDSEYSNKDHNGRSDNLTKAQRTAYAIAFLERMKELGFDVGVYASDSWFVSNLDLSQLKSYSLWVAKYSSSKPKYVSGYDGWQYTSEGRCPGISGNVDKSYIYRDFVKTGVEAMDEKQLKELIKNTIKEELAGANTTTSASLSAEFEEAKAAGITDGSRPGGYMTREQGAVMALRAAKNLK
jgi:GH25 family lysozyme M1 (1,4-beta-N-acetylmuramidase)